jgi:hypothetical protein
MRETQQPQQQDTAIEIQNVRNAMKATKDKRMFERYQGDLSLSDRSFL